MAGEWEVLTLGDLGRIVTGKTPLTADSSNFAGHIPFVTPSDMDGRKTISRTARYLSEAGALSIKGSRIPAGSILVSCIGSDMGKAVIAGRDCVTNQQINSIVVDTHISGEFVYYNLSARKDEMRHQAAGGSAQPILNKGDFSRLEIILPSLAEQEGIAAVLGALDDKIELNRRMNATLETMARALFQNWFVDFDPVRAKLDGRVPVGLDPETAALFPEHLEASALGHTPTGWEVRSLDEIATYLNGLALQKYPPGQGPTLPVIKIAQLRKGNSEGADRCNTDVPREYIVQDGDVLFSWSGSLEVELWCGGSGALNQHLFKVDSAEFPKWFYYLWTLYHLDEFRLIAAGKATTMGHIQRGHLNAAKVIIPPRSLLDAMTSVISPLIDQIISNRIQSRTLATLRDTLLPKLLSGELRIDGSWVADPSNRSTHAESA